MKKITVVPFLETRVKPIINLNEAIEYQLYPIYFKVIYDKKNIYFKSRTEIYTTVESFENYCFNGEMYENQTDNSLSCGYTIDEERNNITDSLKVIDKTEIRVNRKTMLTAIEKLMQPVKSCLIDTLIFKFEIERFTISDNEKYYDFLLSFNNKESLIKSFRYIQDYTDIDLTKYVNDSDIMKFRAIETISEIGISNMEFSKFYLSDYKKVLRKHLKTSQVQYFDTVILIIDNLIYEYCKGIDFEINGLAD